jgi:ribosomal protein S5
VVGDNGGVGLDHQQVEQAVKEAIKDAVRDVVEVAVEQNGIGTHR